MHIMFNLKRSLGRLFCAAPVFTPGCSDVHYALIKSYFAIFMKKRKIFFVFIAAIGKFMSIFVDCIVSETCCANELC